MYKKTTRIILVVELALAIIFQVYVVQAEPYLAAEEQGEASTAHMGTDTETGTNAESDATDTETVTTDVETDTNKQTEKIESSQKMAPKNVIQVSSGQTIAYKEFMNMRATAYTAHPSENGKWGAVDALGDKLKPGTVAVDPTVVPLGTKMFITGYNFKYLPEGGMFAVARDTGSAIKKNKIDIFIPISKEAGSEFGVQKVKVYVLK